jgi:P-type Cu2+ transporter
MSCCAGTIAQAYVAEGMSHQRVEEIGLSRQRLQDGTVLYRMSLLDVHCGACVSTIEKALMAMPGIASARVNLTLRTLMLTLKTEAMDVAPFIQRLEQLGYPPASADAGAEKASDRQQVALIRALAVSGFAAANIMLLSVSVWTGADGATRDLFHFISALIAIPTVAYAGQPFFRSAINALRHRRMNMDVPISLGVLLATLMSLFESFRGGEHAYFDAAVSLLFFLLIGRTLDHMMRARARHLVSQLARLSAKGGMVLRPSGETRYVPLDQILPGMIVRVAAGERIPIDGVIISGESDIDRSFVTGENESSRAGPETQVEAGTLNLTGAIDIRATRIAKESFLADVMQMMAAAEQGRGRYVRIADRMAQIYSPAVHGLAFAAFAGWMLATRGDWHQSLTIAISVLIITCPCALGLAVPVAHVVSASRLFRAGILMKDGSALERMAEFDRVAFDKTGTLTTGEPAVARCEVPAGTLRAVVRSLASRSRHPASQALARYLGPQPDESLENIEEIPGHGMKAMWNGRSVRLGRTEWVQDIAGATATGSTGIGFAVEAGPLFAIELLEQIRASAKPMIASLSDAGLPCEILSGDAQAPVSRIAAMLGIREFRFGLRPADKLMRLAELSSQGHKVLMVGDGLNDAPSLAAAHVSMAPASASDIGRNAADFVFTRGDLSAVTFTHHVAIRARRIVHQNFGLAIAYNLLAVPLAISGLLNPLIAAVAMSTSSIIVVGNSMRLMRPRPQINPIDENRISPGCGLKAAQVI